MRMDGLCMPVLKTVLGTINASKIIMIICPHIPKCIYNYNESTTGADASVEVPKLHNIKLLIASFYTHIDYSYHD